MKYQIFKQFIPGNDQIWVAATKQDGELEIFDTLEQAEVRVVELQELNPGTVFKIIEKQ